MKTLRNITASNNLKLLTGNGPKRFEASVKGNIPNAQTNAVTNAIISPN